MAPGAAALLQQGGGMGVMGGHSGWGVFGIDRGREYEGEGWGHGEMGDQVGDLRHLKDP